MRPERIDAISVCVFDPTGRDTGKYYPQDATHWMDEPVKKSTKKLVANKGTCKRENRQKRD